MARVSDLSRSSFGRALGEPRQGASAHVGAVVTAERGNLQPRLATPSAKGSWPAFATALRRAAELVAKLGSVFSDERYRLAEERGLRLLAESLSPAQRAQYAKRGCFEVVGGRTGRRYRIRRGLSMNVDQLDEKGRRVCMWCFLPEGDLVTEDVMLAQKLALELCELEALGVANRLAY